MSTETEPRIIDRLRERLGPIPEPGEARREWLLRMTRRELRSLAGLHGFDQELLSDCWGWGATAAGLPEGDNVPHCGVCGRKTRDPLWFYQPDRSVTVSCWTCALLEHLVGCERWPDA